MPMSQSVSSRQYVRVEAVRIESDPTVTIVEFAFVAAGTTPVDADYHAGTWATIAGRYYAQIVVGPGALVLAVGRYHVWVRVTSAPEKPALFVDILTIT